MSRHIAKLICFAAAGAAGWYVLVALAELWKGWIPPAGGLGTMVVVYLALYFPLARPIADIIADRFAVLAHRGRHIRSGTGLDSIPDAPKPLSCSICGGPGGPIWREKSGCCIS